MVYRKKAKKTARRRRVYKAKPKNTFSSNFKCGDYHQISSNWYNSSYIPNTLARTRTFNLSDISKGDLLTNRTSNITYLNNINYRETLKNRAGTNRFIRIMIVQVRGSTTLPDYSTWSNLFIDSAFNPSGASGNDYDQILRINQDIYHKLYDRVYKIPGTTSNENSGRTLKLNIPIRKYVSFKYNSNECRKGAVHLIITTCEGSGTAPSATAVDADGEYTLHFYDINRSRKLP